MRNSIRAQYVIPGNRSVETPLAIVSVHSAKESLSRKKSDCLHVRM